jgi:hypothetical protein
MVGKVTYSILIGYIMATTIHSCAIHYEKKIYDDFNIGLAEAQKTKSCILLIFDIWASSNHPTENLLSDESTKLLLNKYIIINLKVDEKYNDAWKNLQTERFHSNFQPAYYILDHKGNELAGPLGYCRKEEFELFITDCNCQQE